MCSLRRYKVSFKSIEIVQEKGFPTHYSILLLILFHTHTHAVGIRVVNGLELLFHVNRMFLFRFKINHVPNFFFRFSSIYQHVHLSLAFNTAFSGATTKIQITVYYNWKWSHQIFSDKLFIEQNSRGYFHNFSILINSVYDNATDE